MNSKQHSKLPRENISTIQKITIGNEKQFEATLGRFTEPLNMQKLGCSFVELKPGKKAWPYHLHYGNDELFLIIKGSGIIRYDDQEYSVSQGDVIYTPPGDGTAHQIINSSDETLQYYAISSVDSPEVCYYPDSDKYGSYYYGEKDNSRRAFIAKNNSKVEYFESEDE